MSKQIQPELSELKLQSEIDDRVGDLVQLGDAIIDKLIPSIGKVDASQLRNAMAVANSAPHPAIVTSFIRYQVGRQTTAKAWKETGLGETLISAIDGDVQRWAKEAADKVKADVSEVQMRMTRLLLGFMNHRFVYESSKHKPKKQESTR